MHFFFTVFFFTNLLFILHWSSIQLYTTYCIRPGLTGILNSIINSPSPLCISLNYLQFYTIKYYHSLWIWMCISILGIFKDYITKLKTLSTK